MPDEIKATYPIDSPMTDERRIHYFSRFVAENYGDFAYIDRKSMEKERDGQWVIMGGVSRPYSILDANFEYPHIRFDVVREAFSIQLSAEKDDIQVIGITRKALKQIIRKKIKSQTSKYETIVLNTVKDKLARIPPIQTSHTPIIQIINNLDNIFSGNLDLTRREYSKWHRYFPLLENLEILTKIDNNEYSMGEAYKQFERILSNESNALNERKLIEQLFGYVIQYGSPYLSEYLHLTASKPYIGLTNTFYYYATKIGVNFKTSIESLQTYYNDIYKGNRFYSHFRHWVLQLRDVGIFSTDREDTVRGNADIFDKINYEVQHTFEPVY